MILTIPRRRRPPRGRLRGGTALVVAAVVVAMVPLVRLQATVVVPADVAELAGEAVAIAHGRVVRVEARQGEGRRVERLVTLQVFEYFKNTGAWGNVVQFRLAGGTLGRYRTVMVGAPELIEGDDLVIFFGTADTSRAAGARATPGIAPASAPLSARALASTSTSARASTSRSASASASADARPFILGLHQGVFRVVTDEASGRRLVMPPVVQGAPAEVIAPAPTRRGDVNRQPLELREFQARIAVLLAARGVARVDGRSAPAETGGASAARPGTAASSRDDVRDGASSGLARAAARPAVAGATSARGVNRAGPR